MEYRDWLKTYVFTCIRIGLEIQCTTTLYRRFESDPLRQKQVLRSPETRMKPSVYAGFLFLERF